jgi:FkbM family methyltransferase
MTHEELVEEFREYNKKHDVMFNFDLDSTSNVLDLGGYLGEWSSEIIKRYNSNVCIIEPIPEFYQSIKNKFINNKKIIILNNVLSYKEEMVDIYYNKDGSSVYCNSDVKTSVQSVKLSNVINNIQWDFIDLVKMNIENSEYDVFVDLIELSLLKKFKNIIVQFHRDIPDYEKKYYDIVNELAKTHIQTFKYDFIWEGWRLK